MSVDSPIQLGPGSIPVDAEPGTLAELRVKGLVIAFRWVPGGSFWMGSREGDESERPVSKQQVPGFWMMQDPVTQGQWTAMMGTTLKDQNAISDFKGINGEGDDFPMYQINWKESAAFCNAVSEALGLEPVYKIPDLDKLHHKDDQSFDIVVREQGKGLRLPTESQWEFACRAGTDTEFWNGDGKAALAAVAWYDANSEGRTRAVDDLPDPLAAPHPYGLRHMHGNVWEWVWDAWSAEAYRQLGAGEVHRPLPRVAGVGRVVRGGAWVISATRCRSAFRVWWLPLERGWSRGFRACLPLPSPATSTLPEGKAGGGAQAVAEQAQPKPPMRPEADAAIDLADEHLPEGNEPS